MSLVGKFGRRFITQSQRSVAAMEGSVSEDAAPKLWGGRFVGRNDPLMEKFNASIGFDKRFWSVDIDGSQAYANALKKIGILSNSENESIQAGLESVRSEWISGTFELKPSDEDIHTANERRLTELIGEPGQKLHTGRSRNDQVATDTRMWLRNELKQIRIHLHDLIRVAVLRAEAEVEILMPGYTHLQVAQPIRWSHWMLAHAWSWKRDTDRLNDLLKRVNMMPLGSGALAGHPFGIDRDELAANLGFETPCPNSVDAVSDRDFVAETLFFCSLTGVHLSRWSEDLIIYGSREFNFVSFSDAYSTGSSLMPQKKNPDALELLRGKSGRFIGQMNGLLTTMKGIPSTYNKDMQEDKEPLFAAIDTLNPCLQIAAGVLSTLTVNESAMKEGLVAEMLATDLADYLVRRGVPFRETHQIAGAAVKLAEDEGISLDQLKLQQLQQLHSAFEEDVTEVWKFESSVEARSAIGGTSRSSVLEQIAKLKKWLNQSD
eukprot:g3040.t1